MIQIKNSKNNKNKIKMRNKMKISTKYAHILKYNFLNCLFSLNICRLFNIQFISLYFFLAARVFSKLSPLNTTLQYILYLLYTYVHYTLISLYFISSFFFQCFCFCIIIIANFLAMVHIVLILESEWLIYSLIFQ